MNRDAPTEVIKAARYHEAGPFQLVGDRFAFECHRSERVSYARVQYYPKRQQHHNTWYGIAWDRGEAWWHLLHQQIPGCPDDGQNRWRKMHTENYWCWYYAPEGS